MPKASQLRFNDPSSSQNLTANFESVNALVRSKCLTCHSSPINGQFIDLEWENEQEFLDSGWAQRGLPLESHFYQTLVGMNGRLRMPPNRALEASEIKMVQDYIISLDPSASAGNFAIIDESKTSFDPTKVLISVRCQATGAVTYVLAQSQTSSGTYQSVHTGEFNCVQNRTSEIIVNSDSVPQLTQDHLSITLQRANGESMSRFSLSRSLPLSRLPAATNRCAPATSVTPTFKLVRLSEIQLRNIVTDLFRIFNVDATAVVTQNQNYLTSDVVANSLASTDFYARLDQTFTKQHIRGIHNLYTNVLLGLEARSGFRTEVESYCQGLSDSDCHIKVVDQISTPLMKGQLNSTARAEVLALAVDFESRYDAITGLIEFALLHPASGFEFYLDAGETGVITLTDEELFYKSFLTLFNTLPTFGQVAHWYSSGRTYHQYVEDLIDNDSAIRAKFEATMYDFYRSWYGLTPQATINTAVFGNLLRGRFPAAIPASFKTSAENGFLQNISRGTASNALTVRGLHFWDSAALQSLNFEELTEYESGEASLPTLAPMIFSYYENNNPFARGAMVYKRLFCGDFGNLSAPADLTPPSHSVTQSTRDHFEVLTPKGSSCFGCHQSINALGFNLEEYDMLGARRNDGMEHFYHPNGSIRASQPLKTEGEWNYMGQFYYTPKISDVYREMYSKGYLRRCTTKQLGQYFLRLRNTTANQCALERVNQSSSDQVREIIMDMLVSDAFTRVRMN